MTQADISHELECAEAAFALLIERAMTHTERRLLMRERNETRKLLALVWSTICPQPANTTCIPPVTV